MARNADWSLSMLDLCRLRAPAFLWGLLRALKQQDLGASLSFSCCKLSL